MSKTGQDGAERPAVVVTGSSSGIGREMALLADGEVVLVARSEGALHALAAEITAKGGKAHVLALDLAEPGAAHMVTAFLDGAGLYCDVLVNNAGYGLIGRFDRLDPADQRGLVDLNVTVLTDLSLAFLPGMLARGRGGVINVASVAGFLPGPNMAVYYASKAFVLSLSEALWQECRGRGVSVTALCPGPVATAFFTRATGGAKDSAGSAKKIPLLFRLMPGTTAEQVARAGWQAFRAGKRVIVPGFLNKLTVFSMRFLPKALVLPVVARFQKGRT